MSDDDPDDTATAGPAPDDGRDRWGESGGGYWLAEPRSDVGTRLPDRRVRTSTGHPVEV